jgi:hypothetical protein
MDIALITEIEHFLRATGMAPTRLGREALGDPGFVASVRKGRKVYIDTGVKLRAFMAAHKAAA